MSESLSDLNENERSRDVVARFNRVIERNSLRYKSLTREAIEQAMVDAFNRSLPQIMGDEWQSYFAYFNESGELKIEVTRLNAVRDEGRYYYFNINLLGEYNIRLILQEFQKYLDYADNQAMYNKLKSLKNGLVYGSVVRYTGNTATVEFYTDDGEIMYGFCPMRHLIEDDRDFSVLRKRDSMLFYVRNIELQDNSRLEIQLSNRSKRIPELLLKRYLQEYGYPINDYRMRCVYRIPGEFSKIVVLNKVNNDVVNACKDELGVETLRIVAVDNKTDIAKFYRGLLSYEDLARNYDIIDRSSKNNRNKKDNRTTFTKEPVIDNNSVIQRFMRQSV